MNIVKVSKVVDRVKNEEVKDYELKGKRVQMGKEELKIGQYLWIWLDAINSKCLGIVEKIEYVEPIK